MLAVAATITALFVLLVALLAVPVVLFIDVERTEALEARWRLLWLFGLLDIQSSGGRSAPAAPSRADAARPVRKRRKERGRGRRMGVAALRARGLFNRVVRLAVALLGRVKLERFHLHTVFGFENPADTGFVYGWLSAVLVMVDVYGLDIRCSPMFLDSGLRGVFHATIRVRPLLVVGTIVAFLLSPPVFRAVGAAWRARQ